MLAIRIATITVASDSKLAIAVASDLRFEVAAIRVTRLSPLASLVGDGRLQTQYYMEGLQQGSLGLLLMARLP